ncbi:hypothetical protein HS088_TW03G00240 [Tripterygium wilfordii]|uniref:AWPM-19-like family protein n=1 Tax=Tripterygium wilfordii TaxID=458696 RepID=A0A7J7DUD3_TRIWF|nr:membrane protein PM19L-like [Tripterygium wilfordii]KAF5749913.1 hypothetical protein HS088_TW03G00240 [Tripterygium wilfordii]
MAVGRDGRDFMGLLLAVNLVVYLIILGLAGWSHDKYIDGEQNHPHLGGNTSTNFVLLFALIAGVTGACSVITGIMHLHAWRSDSLAGASSLGIISWALTTLAFGLVCKEIILGGHRGKRLQTLEAFIIIAMASQLLYVGVLHAGMFYSRYGPYYRSYNNNHGGSSGVVETSYEPQKTDTETIT